MKLHQLPKTSTKKKKRLGHGYGSGKGGHTVGRGQKGQKSRGKLPLWFEGGTLPLIHRLPNLRGKLRFQSLEPKTRSINLSILNQFKSKTTITRKTLIDAGLLSAKEKDRPVKVLGSGRLTKALIVKLPTSKSAQRKIKAAGGRVEPASSSQKES